MENKGRAKPSEWILKDANERSIERWNEPASGAYVVTSILNYLDENYKLIDELYDEIEKLKQE